MFYDIGPWFVREFLMIEPFSSSKVTDYRSQILRDKLQFYFKTFQLSLEISKWGTEPSVLTAKYKFIEIHFKVFIFFLFVGAVAQIFFISH